METDTNPTEAASSEEEEKIYNIGEAAQLKDCFNFPVHFFCKRF